MCPIPPCETTPVAQALFDPAIVTGTRLVRPGDIPEDSIDYDIAGERLFRPEDSVDHKPPFYSASPFMEDLDQENIPPAATYVKENVSIHAPFTDGFSQQEFPTASSRVEPAKMPRKKKLGLATSAILAVTLITGAASQNTNPTDSDTPEQSTSDIAAAAPVPEVSSIPTPTPELPVPAPSVDPNVVAPVPDPNASLAPTPVDPNVGPAPAETSAAAVPAPEIPAPAPPAPEVVAPAPPPPPPPPPPDTIVTSYNTHDEVPAAVTAAEIRTLLTESAIVGAQELAQSEKQEIIRAEIPLCPEPTCKYDGQVAQGAEGGTSIFWDNERYDRVDDPLTGVFKLHETQRIKNSPDSDYGKTSVMKQKVLTVVRLKDTLTGEDKYVVDAHLPYGIQDEDGPDEDEKARMKLLEQDMAIITQKLTELKAAGIDIILMGDFNWREDLDHALSPENIFQALGFKSFYDPDVQNLSPNVFGTHGKGDKPKYRRIDYIMYYSADEETIVNRTILEGFRSDHNPVRATVQS